EDRAKMPDVYRSDTSIKLAELRNLLTRLHGRQENEIPKDKGLCFPNGFISGNTNEMEKVLFSYRAKISSRLYLVFSSNNYIQEDTSMLERSSTISNALLNNKINTLMKGKREINKLAVEEWLTVGNGEDVSSGHTFVLNVNEKTGSSQTPSLSIELKHGPLPDKELSQNELIAFWQQITSTLRLRPGAI
ncbi:T6SS immunity protein Tli4 family protein, partial [Serratia aquatilis]